MEWKKDDREYAWGEVLLLGRWIVAGAHNSSAIGMNDPKKWCATCKLPGIKPDLGSYETAEEAKARAEKAVRHWLAGMTTGDGDG
jgi:hypothetical protein